MSRLLENGITTVAAIEGGWLFDDRDAEFIYAHSGEFPVDLPLFSQTMDLAKVWKLGLRRVGGNIMVDGTLSSHSAALSAPYADRPDYRGQIFLPQDGLDEFVQQCYRQDMQLALYSIGDRAIESVLLAHERAIRQGGSTVPPLASMTCVPGRTSFCQSSPRPAAQIIFPAAATQSAPPSPHMVTQRPFLMMISAYIASRPPVESRVVLWPYCTPGRAVCPVALCPRRQMYQIVC